MKIIITGATGFAGSFLAELLVKNNHEIIGTYTSEKGLINLETIKNKLKLEKINLLDSDVVQKFIDKYRPDRIFHLAALTSAATSFENPGQVMTNNIQAQINILEPIRKLGLNTKILIVSSAEIYGLVEKTDLPIDEDTPLRPTNPYAVSKLAQDYLGLQYFLAYKTQVIRVRPFNHTGPRQTTHFAIASFAKKIVDAEKGITKPVIKVGNLGAKKDFTDVRDMVQAYDLILEKGELGEAYNIGSGHAHAIKDILDILLSKAKIKIEVEVDKSLLRPIDNPELVADSKKMIEITNWEPKITLEKTLEDTLEFWRASS